MNDPTRHLLAILSRLALVASPTRFCDCGCWLLRGETCPACAVAAARTEVAA